MQATTFEFRHRFWFIILTYFVAFMCYRFDHLNATDAFVHWMLRGRNPNLGSLASRNIIQGLLTLSAVLVAAAAGVRTWAGAYLRAEVVFDTKVHSDRVVADGPYRHLRNPLYLGNMLLAFGIAMLASRTGAVILILGNLLVVLRLIGREEAELLQSQGAEYRAFQAAVPRVWPSLSPRLPASGLSPRWEQAFLGESHLWTLALNGFIFAWTLDTRLYYAILGVAGVAYFLMRTAQKRVRRQKSQHAPAA